MRYTDPTQNNVMITIEEGETLRGVVIAVLQASVMLIEPLLPGRLPPWAQAPSEQSFDTCLAQWERIGRARIEYYAGNFCMTEVKMTGVDTLEFNAWFFNRDRGTPEPMLRLAQDILAVPNGGYKGEKLDERLKLLGHERQPGESDWNARLRVAKLIDSADRQAAVQLLYAGPATVWGQVEQAVIHTLFSLNNFAKFADDWADDPALLRANDVK